MYFFFADDSSHEGKREGMGKLVAFGGILIHYERLKSHCEAIEQILIDAGVPPGTELKWSPPRDNWIRNNLQGDTRTALYTDVLKCTSQHDGKAVVVVLDTGRTSENESEAFDKCVDFVFERVSMHLEKKNSHCVIIADRAKSQTDDNRFLTEFLTRIEQGTRYVNSGRVLLNVLTTHSHLIRQLQIADIVTSATTSMVAGNTQYADSVFEQIKPLLMKNNSHMIGGTGLKVYPDSLTNLYHWVIGERAYIRGGGAQGWRLPSPLIPYGRSAMEIQ